MGYYSAHLMAGSLRNSPDILGLTMPLSICPFIVYSIVQKERVWMDVGTLRETVSL